MISGLGVTLHRDIKLFFALFIFAKVGGLFDERCKLQSSVRLLGVWRVWSLQKVGLLR